MVHVVEVVGAWLWANVFGNLVASAICFVAGAIWAHRKWVKPLHAKLDLLHEHVRRLQPPGENLERPSDERTRDVLSGSGSGRQVGRHVCAATDQDDRGGAMRDLWLRVRFATRRRPVRLPRRDGMPGGDRESGGAEPSARRPRPVSAGAGTHMTRRAAPFFALVVFLYWALAWASEWWTVATIIAVVATGVCVGVLVRLAVWDRWRR